MQTNRRSGTFWLPEQEPLRLSPPPSPWLLSALLHSLLPVHKPLCQMPQSHPTAQEGGRQVHLSRSQSLVLKGRGRGQSTTENDEASDRKSAKCCRPSTPAGERGPEAKCGFANSSGPGEQ